MHTTPNTSHDQVNDLFRFAQFFREFRTKHTTQFWWDQLGPNPPHPVGPEVLYVSFFASAENGFYLACNWSPPARQIDLYAEYRNRFNCLPTIVEQKIYPKGEKRPGKNSLIGALIQFGLPHISLSQKDEMTDLVNTGGPWTPAEKQAILDYCESDVEAVDQLLHAMLPQLDIPRALYRARYMAAVAFMEAVGIPIDVEVLPQLRNRWKEIQLELIARVDAQYHVYDGTSFRIKKFEGWLDERGILWPRLDSGQLKLEDEVFKEMAKIHPEVSPLRELRHALSEMRLNDLSVGHDGRNRYLNSPYGTRTSRNAPSSSQSIFGNSVWVRGLIKPPPDFGLAYIDWTSQEIGIAAALSRDSALMAAYQTGDVYLGFAKAAKAVPVDATKESHKLERELFKQCMLGVGYGMKERSLAIRIGPSVLIAQNLLRHHHEIFWRFWEWSDNRVRRAMLTGITYTIFGWKYHVVGDPKERTIRNFPMQANAAEIMRLAVCLGVENGISICCSVHDALLIESPLDRLDSDIARMRSYMEQASEIVLGGFKLRTDFVAVRYPDRYMDERGRQFWNVVISLL
jgi:DNA polymerase family A